MKIKLTQPVSAAIEAVWLSVWDWRDMSMPDNLAAEAVSAVDQRLDREGAPRNTGISIPDVSPMRVLRRADEDHVG